MASSRRQYPFHLIEPKWQKAWEDQQTFRAFNPGDTVPEAHPFGRRHELTGHISDPADLPPKYYILDMFPYPSGAGLHVGHPEGYTATDILARYKRAQGFNVLHPMGWDSFGLPAEQYAIKTGQHPRKTTEENIANFTRQIKSLGFSYDWTRELATTDVDYFKWTQWIFLKLYNSWFNPATNKAEPIETLKYPAGLCLFSTSNQTEIAALEFSRRAFRDSKRLAYVSEAPVNWCPELGTVLANEEVIDGKSEVGGFPVVRRPMRQWMLRITAYAEKLLTDLEVIDWSDSLKEMQRNWIGRSEGAYVKFSIEGRANSPERSEQDVMGSNPETINFDKIGEDIQAMEKQETSTIDVFTTRPDTLFGATYMVLAPESKIVDSIVPQSWPEGTPISWRGEEFVTGGCARPIDAVELYRVKTSAKSDLERTLDDKSKLKTGVFTGACAINPVNGERIPIWIADYVLASYGTGAIMAVPAHDIRDWEFAEKFKLPIKPVMGSIRGHAFEFVASKGGYSRRDQKVTLPINGIDTDLYFTFDQCDPNDGISVNSANAEFSINGLSTAEAKNKITAWLEKKGLGKKTINYKLRDWLFSRQRYWGEPFPIIWKKDSAGNSYHEALPESALPVLPPTLEDYKPTTSGEPPLARAKDWLNLPDGSIRETNTMPQWAGSCWYYLRYLDAQNANAFLSQEADKYWMASNGKSAGVDLYVGGTEHAVLHLLYARFWHKVLFDLGYVSTPEPFYKLVNQGLILGEDGQKMSKSRGNVVNPDDILKEYGADAFRLYEMFMGPLQDTKPWNTKGVEGVYRFLGRVWRLFVDEKSETEFEQFETVEGSQAKLLDVIQLHAGIKDVTATPAQLKVLHACIKKVTEDLDGMRFNTAISAMMVFVNEAITWETRPAAVLRDFLMLLQPFSPHLAEELWDKLHTAVLTGAKSLAYESWPKYDPALLVESEIEIPVSVNGKKRDVIKVPIDADNAALEAAAKASEGVRQFIEGKAIKKVIVVPKKMVNIVVG